VDEDTSDATSCTPLATEVKTDNPIIIETATKIDDLAIDTGSMQEPCYNMRPGCKCSYNHRLAISMNQLHGTKSYNPHIQLLQLASHNLETCPGNMFSYIFGFMMTQMMASQGIRKHGQRAVDALFSEFHQLDDKTVFDPMDASLLSKAQKKAALWAMNLIKEKRSGDLKGRTCANGSQQRTMYTKEETTSPMVSTDALMISLMIDTFERRDVATANVVGAYLNAEMLDFVLLCLTGETVNIMCRVNPRYTSFVVIEGGQKVLYLHLLKALYGCMQSALLWYDLFSTTLQKMGFELNPYDLCIANKMVDGKQCTVAWYVDDNKISHISPAVVTEVVEAIEKHFGKMTVTRGSKHVFLGMDIDFIGDGTV